MLELTVVYIGSMHVRMDSANSWRATPWLECENHRLGSM